MSLAAAVLEHTFAYRLWQAPFAEQKFAPVLAHNDLRRVRRVLDVACGPGTNTHHFVQSDYLGVDLNQRYIANARQRHRRNFLSADVRSRSLASGGKFDFILVNSFLHHLNTDEVCSILSHLCSLLTEDGYIHMLELALPADPSISRLLARWDRGKFPRPIEEWQNIFLQFFQPAVFESYPLTGLTLTLWNMVYFKGRLKG